MTFFIIILIIVLIGFIGIQLGRKMLDKELQTRGGLRHIRQSLIDSLLSMKDAHIVVQKPAYIAIVGMYNPAIFYKWIIRTLDGKELLIEFHFMQNLKMLEEKNFRFKMTTPDSEVLSTLHRKIFFKYVLEGI